MNPDQYLCDADVGISNATNMPMTVAAHVIYSFVRERGIRNLFHFTRETNLRAILYHGLFSRRLLDQHNIAFSFNDAIRLDNAREAISLTIGFPNYKILYRWRQLDPAIKWVVLSISPAVLWNLKCAFCKTNAASNHVRLQDINSRMSVEALADMFGNFPTKTRGAIPSYFTTSPQAEVLVIDHIPAKYILNAYASTPADAKRLRKETRCGNVMAGPEVFKRRCDWEEWQDGSRWSQNVGDV